MRNHKSKAEDGLVESVICNNCKIAAPIDINSVNKIIKETDADINELVSFALKAINWDSVEKEADYCGKCKRVYIRRFVRVFIDGQAILNGYISNNLGLNTTRPQLFRIIQGVPEGTLLHTVYWDEQRQSFCFVVEHESFAPVREGAIIPEYEGSTTVTDVPIEEIFQRWKDEDIRKEDMDHGHTESDVE